MNSFPDNSETRFELEDEIKRLESVYAPVARPTVNQTTLEEKKYTPPSDAYITAVADESLRGYKEQGIAAAKEQNEQRGKALAEERAIKTDAMKSDMEALKNVYESAKSDVDSDVIKRGLARSSIAVNKRAELAGALASKSAEVANRYGAEIAEIDSAMSRLSGDLQTALDDFNLSYAIKLNEKIAELKKERDEKAEKVAEYNNAIREKQAKLDAERLKTESELYSQALEQRKWETDLDKLPEEKRDEIYRSVYEKMDGYLAAMSPEQAKLEIRNHTLYRDHLSDYYYDKLYNKYGR